MRVCYGFGRRAVKVGIQERTGMAYLFMSHNLTVHPAPSLVATEPMSAR